MVVRSEADEGSPSLPSPPPPSVSTFSLFLAPLLYILISPLSAVNHPSALLSFSPSDLQLFVATTAATAGVVFDAKYHGSGSVFCSSQIWFRLHGSQIRFRLLGSQIWFRLRWIGVFLLALLYSTLLLVFDTSARDLYSDPLYLRYVVDALLSNAPLFLFWLFFLQIDPPTISFNSVNYTHKKSKLETKSYLPKVIKGIVVNIIPTPLQNFIYGIPLSGSYLLTSFSNLPSSSYYYTFPIILMNVRYKLTAYPMASSTNNVLQMFLMNESETLAKNLIAKNLMDNIFPCLSLSWVGLVAATPWCWRGFGWRCS